MLPSCTLLVKDFIDACALIDNQGPKFEAASILGALICFPDYFGDMKVLNQSIHPATVNFTANTSTGSAVGTPISAAVGAAAALGSAAAVNGQTTQVQQQILLVNSTSSPSSSSTHSSPSPSNLSLSPSHSLSSPPTHNSSLNSSSSAEENLIVDFYHKEELKNLIVQTLANFNDDYFNNNSRCVILCALTCYIYDEIINQRWNLRRLNDAIKRIFKDLDFKEVFILSFCL